MSGSGNCTGNLYFALYFAAVIFAHTIHHNKTIHTLIRLDAEEVVLSGQPHSATPGNQLLLQEKAKACHTYQIRVVLNA